MKNSTKTNTLLMDVCNHQAKGSELTCMAILMIAAVTRPYHGVTKIKF